MPPLKYSSRRHFSSGKHYAALSELQKKQVKKIAQSTSRASQEKKQNIQSFSSSSTVSGDAYVFNPFYNISQGTGTTNRISRQITVKSIEVTFNLDGQSNGDLNFLLFAYWGDAESVSSGGFTDVSNANILTTLPMVGNTASGLVTYLTLDPFQCTRSWHQTVNVPLLVNTNAHSVVVKKRFNFRTGKKLTYLADGTSYFDGKNFYCGFIASYPGLANGTSINNQYCTYDIKFQE